MSPPYVSIFPAQLPAWLDDGALLVLDVRPSAAYNSARLPCAVSLAVPTTLLKRPLFSLDRLAAMLSDTHARSQFANWSLASRIILYDADSTFLSDSCVLNALLKKFRAEGFTRDLAWIQGGFQAVLREAANLIDTHTFDTRRDDEDDNVTSSHSVLRPNRLPKAAFTVSSTTLSSYDMAPALPNRNKPPGPLTARSGVAIPHNHPACNPFFDVVRQNIELSHGITEHTPLSLPPRVHRRIHDLPFRWLQDIARRASAGPLPDELLTDPENGQGTDPAAAVQGAEILAMQFHNIELAEQRRLMGIMEHHARESGKDGISDNKPFPFSITAGIEKGEKNRYHHIWPFEHARVKLHHKRGSSDDYVNASYVQPLGTRRRYIATQGPLPATCQDFWTLCWQQNVQVIVMLTREVEGSMVKCSAYWNDSTFGPLQSRLISTIGQSTSNNVDHNPGYFAPHPGPTEIKSPNGFVKHGRQPTTIKRTFELTHADYPHVKPRTVIHFQFLEWPDTTVPDDPRSVLALIKEVDNAVQETRAVNETFTTFGGGGDIGAFTGNTLHAELDERTGIAKCALGEQNPVLLHCSAGVGRTGGFIAVDAVLDAVRRELKKAGHRKQPMPNLNVMGGTSILQPCSERNLKIGSENGSSSPSVLACSESSSSDDSFEFDRHARLCGRSQSPLATSVSPPSPRSMKSNPRVPVSGSLQMNGVDDNSNPVSSELTDGHERLPGFNSPCQWIPPDDSSSRSISPSADESELNAPMSCDRDHSMIPPASSSPPLSPSPTGFPSAHLKEPRRLHDDRSPVQLGTFEEPIWEVVQDMREQRMSLCQSLRQYVFVHAAVVEGALMIVDEERQREKMDSQTTSRHSTSLMSPKIYCKPTPKANKGRPIGLSVRSNGLVSALLTGKRVASPTELPKENKQGQLLLSKRPILQKAKSP